MDAKLEMEALRGLRDVGQRVASRGEVGDRLSRRAELERVRGGRVEVTHGAAGLASLEEVPRELRGELVGPAAVRRFEPVADPSVDPNQTAEAAYRAAIDLAPPEDYAAQVALARLLGKTPGREADAVAILAPVEKAALADSVLANTLGEAYLGVKDSAAAERWFRQALAVNEANATARSNLGAALELAGKMPEALVEYELALVSTPNRLRSLVGAARAAESAGEAGRGKTLRNLVAALTGVTGG